MMKYKIFFGVSIVLNLALLFLTYRYWSNEQKRAEDSENSFKFDTISTKVVARSSYVMLGDKYTADVFLTAFSTTMPFELRVDSTGNPNEIVSYDRGICKYESIPDSVGSHKFSGKVEFPFKDQIASYPFQAEYMVARPQVNITPGEFVLTRGKENKVNVSIPGVALNALSVLVSNATISGENGKYIIIPGKENKCLITVAFKNSKGEYVKMAQEECKVIDK